MLVLTNAATVHAPANLLNAPFVDLPLAIVPTDEISPLLNMSVRGTLAAGQIITPAFYVGGRSGRLVLIRAIGPSLGQFGVTAPLAAPSITVFSGQTVVATNAGWGGSISLDLVFRSVGAFQLPAASRDAAVLLLLNPGAYTVQVGGGAGEVLVEVYTLNPQY